MGTIGPDLIEMVEQSNYMRMPRMFHVVIRESGENGQFPRNLNIGFDNLQGYIAAFPSAKSEWKT